MKEKNRNILIKEMNKLKIIIQGIENKVGKQVEEVNSTRTYQNISSF